MPCLAYQYQTRKVFGKSSNHYFAVPFSVTTRGADMTHFSFNCVGFLWQFLRSLLLGHSPPKNKKRTLRYRMKAARFSHQSFQLSKATQFGWLICFPHQALLWRSMQRIIFHISAMRMQLNSNSICFILHGHFGQNNVYRARIPLEISSQTSSISTKVHHYNI